MASEGGKQVERLFPFVVRARKLLIGREAIGRNKSQLQWVLLATDLSESSKEQMLKDFAAYPIVQRFTSGEFERFFNVRNTKVVGFIKSTLAKSIYAELKESRLNKEVQPAKPEPAEEKESPPSDDSE